MDIDPIVAKIKEKGHDPSDYFNFGFTPEQWKSHAEKIKNSWETYEYKEKLQDMYQEYTQFLAHPQLNFIQPHDFGGLNAPLGDFKRVNTYQVTEES